MNDRRNYYKKDLYWIISELSLSEFGNPEFTYNRIYPCVKLCPVLGARAESRLYTSFPE